MLGTEAFCNALWNNSAGYSRVWPQLYMRDTRRCTDTYAVCAGIGASVSALPSREHFLAVPGDASCVHSTWCLRSLLPTCLTRFMRLRIEDSACLACSLLNNWPLSTTKASSTLFVMETNANWVPPLGGSSLNAGIYIYISLHIYTGTYIYMYMYVCIWPSPQTRNQ